MKIKLPVILDAPERPQIIVAAIYGILSFFSLPYICLLFLVGPESTPAAVSWFEIGFHVLNFGVIVSIFRETLVDAFWSARLDKGSLLPTIAIGSAAILGISQLFRFLLQLLGGNAMIIAAFGALPLSEMEMFYLSADLIYANPLFSTLCMVLLTPVTVSCLYYAVGFVPAFNVKPWLGYLVVCAIIAFPLIGNAATVWDTPTEIVLYLSRLPLYLIACWSYRRTNNLWTPICIHAITNLISSLYIWLTYAI